MSLLNIPEMMDFFGQFLHEFWETVHESYIQNIKGEVDNMSHTDDFLVTILLKVLKTLVLARVMEDNPYDQQTQHARRENFKIYKIKQDEDPSDVLEDNNAASGIIDDQGRMMLCVEHVGDSTRDIALYPVVFNRMDNGDMIGGIHRLKLD